MPAILSLLRIKNLALVEELEWQMGSGFIAVTGETGAGKSIIIGALQLLLGERTDKSLIRTGADLCTVEAVFGGRDLQKLNSQLVETGVEPCDSDLIIKRSFSVAGGTRQFINGSPTTLSVLKNLGDELVDLHGPHDHQSLLSPENSSVLSQLAETQRLLRELEKIDNSIAQFSSAHAASVVELSEIARALSTYVEKLDLDPEQLAALEQRVSLFETLKRKYGGSIPEVIVFGERAAERMQKIEGRDMELERLAKEIDNVRRQMNHAGEALRKLRAKAAPKLSESVRRNLRDLGFRQSEFEAKLTALDEPRPSGLDSVELLFSPNPGEPLKPLRAIASSGEISRLMLAIKSALAAHDAIPLLVFDEIDTNVGGEIAHAVGSKMQALGRDHQVICITHLPQVAATASSHFVVMKDVSRGRTFSNLREVTGKARREEIARMLGGKSESALKLAASLLKKAV